MPIITFGEGDRLAAVTMDAGWYRAVVKTIEMKTSSSEKSTNFWTEFEITSEGKFKGKELKSCFNTETNGNSLLGTTQFRPHSDLIPLYAATNKIVDEKGNISLAAVPLNMDTDELLMKEFDLQVMVDIAEGLPVNKTGGFAPAGKATSATAVAF